jgi:Icc-related predicted phosphoesterase
MGGLRGAAFGDLHGRIRGMYDYSLEMGGVDVILQVGDFGVFPDPSRLSEEKIGRFGHGDYAELIAEGWAAPIPTYFCKGNNEDFQALEGPLPHGLTHVPDGEVITLGTSRVAFVGGGWAPKSYASDSGKPNHLSRIAVEKLFGESFDILVCHEAPAGTRLPGRAYSAGAPPLRDLIEERRPALVIHGHHHFRGERTLGPARIVSLDLFRPESPESATLRLDL